MKDPIEQLVTLLSRLPGIGARTARRLVFHLLEASPDYCEALGREIATLRERVHPCSVCGHVTEEDPCPLCTDTRRDPTKLCVVTTAADLLAIERAGSYRGRYHVLGGLLAPLDGVGPEELRIDGLLERLAEGAFEELIVATPPTVEGEATATYLAGLIDNEVSRVTRIASGVPHGGDLELSDPVTLGRAFDGRRDFS